MSIHVPYQHLQRCLQEFRKLNPDMTTTTATVFLEIVNKPGITSLEIMANLGLSQPSVSRNTRALGDSEGLDLIERVEHPEDARHKQLFLTMGGIALAIRLFQILDPNGLAPSVTDFAALQRRAQKALARNR